MINYKVILLMITLYLGCIQLSFGQQVLTIDEAVTKASEQYPGMEVARLAIEREKALKKTAWDLGNTQLFTSREEAGYDQDGVQTVLGIQQQQINIFGIGPKQKLADQKTELAEANYSVYKRKLEKTVKLAWVQAFSTKKKYLIYVQLDSIFSDLEKAANLQLETESIAKLDWLALTNRSKQIDMMKLQSFKDHKTALESLNKWFGDSKSYYDVGVNAPDIKLMSINDSLAPHPEMDYYRQKVEVAKARVGVSKSAFLPQFNVQYGFQRIADQSGFYRYQFGIGIPLFFGPELGRMQSSRIEKDLAQQAYRVQNQSFNAQYKTKVEQYQKWKESWSYYETEAIPLADEQLEGAVFALKEGAIDYIGFIQYVKDAIDIKLQGQSALENYLKSYYSLEYFVQNI